MNPDLASYLRRLADRVERLAPSRTDPERFHIDKSELAHALRKLARDSGRHPRATGPGGAPRVNGAGPS